MNRKIELAHLAAAEKRLAECQRHIVLQEQLVSDLDRDGHDTRRALTTLEIFRRLQDQHLARRDFLLKILQEDAAEPQLPTGPIFRPGHYESDPAEK